MKFLIDVNASRSLGNWLIEMGHDVIYVTDTDPQMTDDNILEWAVVSGRVIVTTDNDFEQIIWQQRKSHCGVLRLENLPREQRKTLLIDAIELHGQDLLDGKIVIAMKIKGNRELLTLNSVGNVRGFEERPKRTAYRCGGLQLPRIIERLKTCERETVRSSLLRVPR